MHSYTSLTLWVGFRAEKLLDAPSRLVTGLYEDVVQDFICILGECTHGHEDLAGADENDGNGLAPVHLTIPSCPVVHLSSLRARC